MKLKTLLSTIAIFTGASSANAADIIKQMQVLPATPASNWTGPYLGIETGTVISKFHSDVENNGLIYALAKPKQQPLSGVYAGFNFAIGQKTILGLDANIDYHSIESISPTTWYVKYHEKALAAARLRIGLAQDNFMPYIAGGLSVARAGLSVYNIDNTPNTINKQKNYLGWNIGTGIDYAVTKNMFLRADYRFSNVKIKDLYILDTSNVIRHADSHITTRSHELRIGAAYKF